jgi:hypothetical protein
MIFQDSDHYKKGRDSQILIPVAGLKLAKGRAKRCFTVSMKTAKGTQEQKLL